MLQPLKQFICDSCGHIIQSPDHGEVLWQADFSRKKILHYDYTIVHMERYKQGCTPHNYDCNAGIESFIQQFLLHPDAWDIKEYMELMRRLTIPYYEEARAAMQHYHPGLDYYQHLCHLAPCSRYFEGIAWAYSK